MSHENLREAAQALIDRWETPLWKDAPATAEYIHRLRAALADKPTGEGLPQAMVSRNMWCGKFKGIHDFSPFCCDSDPKCVEFEIHPVGTRAALRATAHDSGLREAADPDCKMCNGGGKLYEGGDRNAPSMECPQCIEKFRHISPSEAEDLIRAVDIVMNPVSSEKFFPKGWNILLEKLRIIRDGSLRATPHSTGGAEA